VNTPEHPTQLEELSRLAVHVDRPAREVLVREDQDALSIELHSVARGVIASSQGGHGGVLEWPLELDL
jgi:hypothetical protein